MYKLLTVFLPCVLGACAADVETMPAGDTPVRVTVSWEADGCRDAGKHFYDTTVAEHFEAEKACAIETQGEFGTLHVVRQCNEDSPRLEHTYENWSYATGSITYWLDSGKVCTADLSVSLAVIQ